MTGAGGDSELAPPPRLVRIAVLAIILLILFRLKVINVVIDSAGGDHDDHRIDNDEVKTY